MARHRDVRAINIDEEYDGYYDSCYGHSVEEDFCISPQTEAQFLYNRAAQEKHSMSAFLDSSSPNALQEEIETEDNSCCLHSNSVSKVKESLNPVDKAKLQSCIELMQNVVGETISEGMLSRAAMENKFNVEKALNAVLSGYQPPKTKHIEKDQKFEKEEFCVLRKYKHFIHKYKKWVIHGDLNDFSIWFKLLREIINCHVGSSSHLAVSNILNAYFSLIYPSKSDPILQTLNLGSEEMGLLNDCAMHLNKIVNSFLHILIKNYCHVYNITDHHHQMCKELHLFITELNSKMKIEQNPYLTSVNCLILSSVKLLFMPFTTLLQSVIKICFTSLESIPSMTKSQQNQSKAVALIIFLHFMLIILKSLIRCLLSVGKVYRSLDCKTISKFSGEFCSAVLLMNLNCIISAFQMMLSWCGTVTNFFFSAGFFSTGSGQRISPLVHARLEKWLIDHLSLNFIPCKKHVKEPKDCSYFLSFCLPPFSIQCATKLFSFTLENHINFKVLMQQICKYYLKIEMGRVISKLCEECKLLYSCVKTYFYRLHNLWWKNNVRCRRMYKISENILYQFFMYLVSLHGNKFHFDSPVKKKRNYLLKNPKPSGLSKFSACKKCYFNMLLLSTLLEHQSEVICNQKDFKLHSNKTCFGPKPQLLDQSSCHLNGQKLCCPNLLNELRVFDHDFQTNVKLPSPLKNPINAKPSWKENLRQVQVNVSSNLHSKSSINMSSNAAVLHSDAADILLKNICCLPSSEDFSEESEYNSLFRIEKKDQIKSSHISLSELHSYSTSSSIKNLDSSLLKETLSFSKDLSLGSEGSSVFRIEEKDQIKSPCMSLPELHSYSNSNNIETLDPILGQQPTDVPSLLDLYLKEVKCQKQDVENEKCKSKIEHEDQNKSLTSSLSELCSYSNCNGNNNLDSTMEHHSSDLSVSDLNLKDVTCQKKDTLSNISLTDLYFNAIKTKSNIYKEQNLCNASKSDVCKDLNTGSLNTSNEKIGAVDIWLSEFTGAEDSATISNRSIQYHDAQNESFSSPNNLYFEFKMPTRDSKCGDMLRKASSCDNEKDLHVKENSIPNETNFSQDHNFLSTWLASSSERFLIDESNLEIMTNPESTAFIDLSLAFKAKNVNTSDYEFQMLSPRSDEVINMNILNTNTLSSCEHLKNVASKGRYRGSLFSKVLCCKSKDDCSVAILSPPETLTEIAASIQYTKYFNFNTPSPDDQVAAKQKGAFGNAGFKSKSDLGPKLEVIEDEPEVIGRLMISNGKIKSVGNVEKSVNQITFEKKSEKILTDCTEELLCHSGISEDLNGKVPPKSVKNEDLNVIAVDSTNRLKSRASGKNVVEAYNKERGGEKPLINLVVVGHVDAGKSTLMGHLLFRLGCVAKKAMHKYEQDSKKLGKASFMYAWVLDETSEERTRGITMDVAQSKFITPHRSVVLLDAPGHKDFIPNMITGAAQADVAVLVVDATRGEFETGFETGGQTREHTMLIRSLGVSQLAVAVNKLDNVNWDQGRYKEIVAKLSSFLKQAGFKEGDVQFVPCSGLTGENLTEPPKISELKSWYSSCCLVDVIDSFKPPERPVSKPFRMCISDVFKGMGSGFCVSGRIEAGYVQNGDRVLVMPAGEQAIIKGITIDDTSMQHSFAGDHVTMQLSGVDTNNMSSGSVVCDVARPVKVSAKFQARLVVFNIDTPITKGFPVVLHSQSMSEQAVIKKLVSQLHRSSGQVIKKKPRCLLKNTSAVVELEVIRPICIELYKDFKDLGRFMLRSSGSTIAAGLITEIY